MRVRSRLLHGFYLRNVLVEPLRARVSIGEEHSKVSAHSMEALLFLVNHSNEYVAPADLADAVWDDADDANDLLSASIDELRKALGDEDDHPSFVEGDATQGYRLLVDPYSLHNERIPKETRRAGEQPQFIDELLQRGVVQTGLTYLVVGWLLVQVSDVLFDKLPLPQWSTTFVAWLVIGGFPIALALSWFMEFARGRWRLQRRQSLTPRKKFLSRAHFSVLLGLLVAGGGVAVYQATVGLPETTTREPEIASAVPIEINPASVAVLRFVSIDDTEDSRVFADGLSEDIRARLSWIPGLKVPARGDSRSLGSNPATHEVRTRMRVAYYLEGSVRLVGDKLRVIVQLIDTDDGDQLFSRSFDRELTGFFDMQDEITGLAVDNMRVALPATTQGDYASVVRTEEIGAYVLYRKGKLAYDKPKTEDSIAEALGWFNQSLTVDPDYAAAHAGLCLAYASGYHVTNDASYIDEAEKACAAALALNDNLDVVHVATGNLSWKTGRSDEAELSYEKALAINPNNVEAHFGLANVYYSQKKINEAEDKYVEAILLQPGNWASVASYGIFLFRVGRYAKAAEVFAEVVRFEPENAPGYSNLSAALMLSGDFERALEATRKSIEIEPIRTAYTNLGTLYYYLGRFEEAVQGHRKAVELSPDYHLVWANLGDSLFFSGDRDAAGEAYRKAEALALARIEVNGQDAETMFELAMVEAMLGNADEARALIGRAKDLAPDDPYLYAYSANVEVVAGNLEHGLAEVQGAIGRGYPINFVIADPMLAPLRQDSRFDALVRSAGR